MFISGDYLEIMTHFGILSLAATGHLNTMFSLGYELRRRGHKVTFLSNPNAQIPVQRAGFNFCQARVAARIAWTGVGELVKLSSLSVNNLRESIKRVLQEPSFKQNAVRLQQALHRTEGVNHAVDIIEQAVSTKKPVINRSPGDF